MKNKLNTKVIIGIIASSILLGVIYNYFSIDGIDFIRKPLVVNSLNSDGVADTSALTGITLAQTLNIYNTKAAVFIDARDQWDYSTSHIDGAVNIPEFSFEPSDSTLSAYSKSKLLIVYCDGDDCDISKRLATEFVKLGYSNTFIFLGGIKEWEDANAVFCSICDKVMLVWEKKKGASGGTAYGEDSPCPLGHCISICKTPPGK